MNIRKRTGEVVPFQEEKILNAMKKAFSGQGQEIDCLLYTSSKKSSQRKATFRQKVLLFFQPYGKC